MNENMEIPLQIGSLPISRQNADFRAETPSPTAPYLQDLERLDPDEETTEHLKEAWPWAEPAAEAEGAGRGERRLY